MMMCRHKLEEQEEIMMESDEEGLLATNLIEELVGSELGFQLRYIISNILSCHHATSVLLLPCHAVMYHDVFDTRCEMHPAKRNIRQ